MHKHEITHRSSTSRRPGLVVIPTQFPNLGGERFFPPLQYVLLIPLVVSTHSPLAHYTCWKPN